LNIYKFQNSYDAIWKAKDYDFPIAVNGFVFSKDDSTVYFSIEESKTFIPYNEIEFTKANPILLILKSLNQN
jgi:hypothetical protein